MLLHIGVWCLGHLVLRLARRCNEAMNKFRWEVSECLSLVAALHPSLYALPRSNSSCMPLHWSTLEWDRNDKFLKDIARMTGVDHVRWWIPREEYLRHMTLGGGNVDRVSFSGIKRLGSFHVLPYWKVRVAFKHTFIVYYSLLHPCLLIFLWIWQWVRVALLHTRTNVCGMYKGPQSSTCLTSCALRKT